MESKYENRSTLSDAEFIKRGGLEHRIYLSNKIFSPDISMAKKASILYEALARGISLITDNLMVEFESDILIAMTPNMVDLIYECQL